MSSRELSEWQEYAKLEPFGEERDDIRIALLCQQMANMWAKKKDGSPFLISDFLLNFLTPERIEAILSDDDIPVPTPSTLFGELVEFGELDGLDASDSFDSRDERAAKENALRMAKLIVLMNKALGGVDKRSTEKRERLEHETRMFAS